jgi:hypothetical protein
MRQMFDGNNETCQMVDGSAAIHPHNVRVSAANSLIIPSCPAVGASCSS